MLAEKVVISLDTEFIENEKEDVVKQDCEIEAAKRLLKRLAKDYPRLPVCIQGDSLYEAEPLMEICRGKKWKYVLPTRQQDKSFWMRVMNGSDREMEVRRPAGSFVRVWLCSRSYIPQSPVSVHLLF